MDYGGNSIGVGLVTWGFFSPARHQPPDHETADREATSSAQKYSQTIATTIERSEIFSNYCNIQCSEIFSNYNCKHNHDVGESANPWSHSYLAMDTICPILAPLRERGRGRVGHHRAGSRWFKFSWICCVFGSRVFARSLASGCCLNGSGLR